MHVISGSSLKVEAHFTVHPHKRSIISSMLTVGDGVWVNIKQDSTLRLFHASSFQHLQDLDVGPSINRLLCKCNYGFGAIPTMCNYIVDTNMS